MGGGKSQSETKTDQSTKVETTTTTSIGDIGLTGKDATALAKVIADGATVNSQALTQVAVPLAEIFKEGFKRNAEQSAAIVASEKTVGQLLAENAPFIAGALAAAAAVVYLGRGS